MRYSAWALARNAFSGHRHWPRAWRDPAPKPRYDVIIVGGGGHGLATAYYLAKKHGITNVAVLEMGYLGSGNAGRNTTIIRSNYLLDPNTQFYEHSMQLWESLSQELNYNVMFSQRGQLYLCNSRAQMEVAARRGNIMRLNGIDAEILNREEVQARIPFLDFSTQARFPIYGAIYQGPAGTARHDAVVWGYARAGDALGVDLIQNCEVTGFRVDAGRVSGVETSRGAISAAKIAIAVAGSSGRLAEMAGFKLPIESHVLQAFVSEPIKPFLDLVIGYGAAHFYISQSDKGGLVFGGDLDGYNSYAQRGNLPVVDPCHGRRQGDDARSVAPARGAAMGRPDGYVHGRQSDHLQRPARRVLFECRLVLWRLQGDTGLGLVLRPHHRQRRAAPFDCQVHP